MEKNCFTLSNSQPASQGISPACCIGNNVVLGTGALGTGGTCFSSLVVFLSHYAKQLIVTVSIFPIESAELSLDARSIVFTNKIFIYQKYFKFKSRQSVLQINTMSRWSSNISISPAAQPAPPSDWFYFSALPCCLLCGEK